MTGVQTCALPIYLLTAKDPNQFYNPQTDELLWRDAVPNLSEQFADFLDWMMKRSPSKRPANTEEILQRLLDIKPISLLPTLQTNIPFNTNNPENFNVTNPPKINQVNTLTTPTTPITPITTINAGFFYQWMLSNIVSIGIGLFIRSIFIGAAESFFGQNEDYRYAMLAGIITLVPVEIMQWLVLKRRIAFNFWSFIETLLGFLLGLFIGTFAGRILYPGYEGRSLGAVIGAIAGTSIVKWLIIRQQIKNSWAWLILYLVGISIGIFSGAFTGYISYSVLKIVWNPEDAWTVSFVISVLTTSILSSCTSGIGLLRLFRRRVN